MAREHGQAAMGRVSGLEAGAGLAVRKEVRVVIGAPVMKAMEAMMGLMLFEETDGPGRKAIVGEAERT